MGLDGKEMIKMQKIKMLAVGAAALAGVTISTTAAEAAPSANARAKRIIMMRESSGNPNAVNRSSGAMGLFQCMPSVHKCPPLGNAAAQSAWADKYVKARYGSWVRALAHHNARGWY